MNIANVVRKSVAIFGFVGAASAVGLMPAQAWAVPARPGDAVALSVSRPPGINSPATGLALRHVAERLARGSLHIVAFGSSSTQGVGASSAAASYPSRLQVDLSGLLPKVAVAVENQGIGGDDAADMERRLPNVLAAHPDLVIFQTGTNDPLRGLPIDRFVALTREVVGKLQGAHIDVMLMEPQLCRVTQATPSSILYRDAVRSVASDMRVPLIRRWDLMASWLSHDLVTPVQMLAPDGLHMADAGYSLLAHEVAREIVASIE